MAKLTPAEAFEMLRERRVREIMKGRELRQIPTPELLDLLRLEGAPIPIFDNEEAALAWHRTASPEYETWCSMVISQSAGK
jgi:hypothetical protein